MYQMSRKVPKEYYYYKARTVMNNAKPIKEPAIQETYCSFIKSVGKKGKYLLEVS